MNTEFLTPFEWFMLMYTKKKVDTFSTLIMSYTNSVGGKCHISYEREIYPL